MMTDDAFARLVSAEVKNKATPEQRAFLRDPANHQRWKRALIALIDALDEQIEDLKAQQANEEARVRGMGSGDSVVGMIAELQYHYSEKIRKTHRFKHYVENRLAEVERLSAAESDDPNERLVLFNLLTRAIEKHEELSRKFAIEATPIDNALYAALKGQWLFDDITEEDFDDGGPF